MNVYRQLQYTVFMNKQSHRILRFLHCILIFYAVRLYNLENLICYLVLSIFTVIYLFSKLSYIYLRPSISWGPWHQEYAHCYSMESETSEIVASKKPSVPLAAQRAELYRYRPIGLVGSNPMTSTTGIRRPTHSSAGWLYEPYLVKNIELLLLESFFIRHNIQRQKKFRQPGSHVNKSCQCLKYVVNILLQRIPRSTLILYASALLTCRQRYSQSCG